MARQPSPDIAGIQYLRGIAATMVVLFHLMAQRGGADVELGTLQSGVDIFFVVSGFVMVYSSFCVATPSGREFIRKRLIRIAPLYWAANIFMILVLLIAPRLVKSSHLEPVHALASLLFVAAPNPSGATITYLPLITLGWTLELEMLFYILFALALDVTDRRKLPTVTLVSVILFGFSCIGLAKGLPSFLSFQGFYTNPIMLEFLFGMLIALVFLRTGRFGNGLLWAIVGALAFVCLVALPGEPLLYRPFRYGFAAASIVAASVFAPMPRYKAPHRLGDISYSLYLSHYFILSAFTQLWFRHFAFRSPAEMLSYYAIGLCLAVLGGYLTWRLVERPLLELLRGRRRNRRSPAELSTAD
jgi:peptidoglycan/LPS O-acetylase OafA/YrhL